MDALPTEKDNDCLTQEEMVLVPFWLKRSYLTTQFVPPPGFVAAPPVLRQGLHNNTTPD